MRKQLADSLLVYLMQHDVSKLKNDEIYAGWNESSSVNPSNIEEMLQCMIMIDNYLHIKPIDPEVLKDCVRIATKTV